MKFLFLAAHPDDLEYFCSSLLVNLGKKQLSPEISKYITDDEKNSVSIACMTRGEMSSFTDETKSTRTAAKIRTTELETSCHILGLSKPIFLGSFDGFVRVSEQSVSKVQRLIQQERPDVIIAPEPIYTWYAHPDHTRTGKIAFYAIRRIYKEQSNLLNTYVPALYYYGALFNQIYIPILSQDQKVVQNALNAHKSQQLLLIQAKIPGFISNIKNGMKIPHFRRGEALRRQLIVPIKNQKNTSLNTLIQFDLKKRILYHLAHKLCTNIDYSKRILFKDGTLKPDFI